MSILWFCVRRRPSRQNRRDPVAPAGPGVSVGHRQAGIDSPEPPAAPYGGNLAPARSHPQSIGAHMAPSTQPRGGGFDRRTHNVCSVHTSDAERVGAVRAGRLRESEEAATARQGCPAASTAGKHRALRRAVAARRRRCDLCQRDKWGGVRRERRRARGPRSMEAAEESNQVKSSQPARSRR